MDSELDENKASAVRAHLALCGACAKVCEDLASILEVCTTASPDELLPSDSKAMWLRINNVIENERPELPRGPEKRAWAFSFGQLAVALGCIALVSSVVTVFALRSYWQPPSAEFAANSTATQTTFEKVLGRLGLMETPQQARERRLREQQAAIEYWTARVQNRRSQWDRATREAFDRNLRVIDESVAEYTTILQRDPDDELSSEMLDAVMHDKMNFLRDFSDL